MAATDARIEQFKKETDKALDHLHSEFSKLQTGRANTALVDHIEVEAYGVRQPLRNIAGVTVSDARTIQVQAWDRAVLSNIERALQQADLGINPVNDGNVIRLNLPSMNQERREQLTKVVQQLAEAARITVRQQRQTVHDAIKTEKDEDVKTTLVETLQKAVDEVNAKISEAAKKKEEEVMKV